MSNNFTINQSGATVLEFSLVSILFFTLLSGVFDIGMTLFRSNSLQNTTASVVREVAGAFKTRSLPKACEAYGSFPNQCWRLEECATLAAESYFEDRFSVDNSSIQFSGRFLEPNDPENLTGEKVLRISADWSYQCFFCLALQKNLNLRTRSEAVVDGLFCTI